MGNQQPSNKQEWRQVKEHPNYEVNYYGDIRHKQRKKILKPRSNNGGYLYVNFVVNGNRKNFAVHRIVANVFIPNPKDYSEVNHIDYNKQNNCVDNLEWVSSSQNKNHAYQKEINHISRGKSVEQLDKQGNSIKIYSSVSQAAKELNCSISAISNCASGRTKTSQGYQWRFVEGSTTKYERNPGSQRETP